MSALAATDLFGWAATRSIPAADPNVVKADQKRLAGQNLTILERLQQGPASNAELSGISLKYTSRISDLREAGYTIHCTRGQGGLNTYTLDQ